MLRGEICNQVRQAFHMVTLPSLPLQRRPFWGNCVHSCLGNHMPIKTKYWVLWHQVFCLLAQCQAGKMCRVFTRCTREVHLVRHSRAPMWTALLWHSPTDKEEEVGARVVILACLYLGLIVTVKVWGNLFVHISLPGLKWIWKHAGLSHVIPP